MARSDQSVIATRPPGQTEGETWSDLPLPLRECGEIAALRLSSAFSDALTQASETLFKDATEALTPHEREAFADAAEFARQHRNGMVFDFMKHFEQRYMRACRRRPNYLLGHDIDFDAKEMRIVEHHLLDDSLDPGKITEAIQNSCWKTLQMLTSQFRDMLDCQDLMPNDLPLGPRVIEGAVSDALLNQPWRHKAKHRLANALRWGLATRVNLLYRDLVDLLNAQDLKAFSVEGNGVDTQASEPSKPGVAQPGQSIAGGKAEQVILSAGQPADMTGAQAAADQAAQGEVERCLGSATLPLAVEEFLNRHWRDHLARIHLSLGPSSTAWRDAVHTMDDLAWSLTSKSSQEDYARLKEGLPGLLKRLHQGMEVLALPLATRDRFLVLLVEYLGDIMEQCESQFAPTRAAVVQTEPTPIQVPLMTSQLPDRAQTLAVSQPEGPPPAVVQTPAPDLTVLKVGAWVEFLEPDGQTRELKLAWISPHRNLYLLTNREGERALSLKAENLARRLQEGQARITQTPQAPHKNESIASLRISQKTA